MDLDLTNHGLQVFEPKEWASLTGRSILPKLAYCLDHEFTVNPVDQKLEPLGVDHVLVCCPS